MTGDVRFLPAIFIDSGFDSKWAYINLKYRLAERGSLSWEPLQTLGLKCLFGYAHIRLRYESYPYF